MQSTLPTLARCTAVEVAPNVIAMIGGGFTCFSFGNFLLRPLLMTLKWTSRSGCDDDDDDDDDLVTALANILSPVSSKKSAEACDATRGNVCAAPSAGSSPRLVVFSELSWNEHPRTVPVKFSAVPIGPCVTLWKDVDYLKQRIGTKTILIHAAPQSHYLDFIQKNYAFKHVTFHDLIAHCFLLGEESGENNGDATTERKTKETWYFRSVGMTAKKQSEYSSVWRDFAEIASDLILPQVIQSVVFPRMQQSVLRVNQKGMQLWTHYDTLDNILVQVVGRKRVIIFPPSQYGNLYMEGSSSRVVNLEQPDLKRFPRFSEAKAHGLDFTLEPGDVLVIPAMWLHHVTAIDACISVNIFYETLPKEMYDPKDMYGNKDLPASVRAREDVVRYVRERVLSSNAIPAPHDEFTLRQIIADLEELGNQISASRRVV